MSKSTSTDTSDRETLEEFAERNREELIELEEAGYDVARAILTAAGADHGE